MQQYLALQRNDSHLAGLSMIVKAPIEPFRRARKLSLGSLELRRQAAWFASERRNVRLGSAVRSHVQSVLKSYNDTNLKRQNVMEMWAIVASGGYRER